MILLLVPMYTDTGEFLGACGIELNAVHFSLEYPGYSQFLWFRSYGHRTSGKRESDWIRAWQEIRKALGLSNAEKLIHHRKRTLITAHTAPQSVIIMEFRCP